MQHNQPYTNPPRHSLWTENRAVSLAFIVEYLIQLYLDRSLYLCVVAAYICALFCIIIIILVLVIPQLHCRFRFEHGVRRSYPDVFSHRCECGMHPSHLTEVNVMFKDAESGPGPRRHRQPFIPRLHTNTCSYCGFVRNDFIL